jgi:hypothetical protein
MTGFNLDVSSDQRARVLVICVAVVYPNDKQNEKAAEGTRHRSAERCGETSRSSPLTRVSRKTPLIIKPIRSTHSLHPFQHKPGPVNTQPSTSKRTAVSIHVVFNLLLNQYTDVGGRYSLGQHRLPSPRVRPLPTRRPYLQDHIPRRPTNKAMSPN